MKKALGCIDNRKKSNRSQNFKGRFGVQNRKIEYDKIILSYLNSLFAALIGYDKLNLLLILSYSLFVVSILSFCWVSNLIRFLKSIKTYKHF